MHPEELAALFIPLFALMIPIVVILTKHQQRMAELIHGSAGKSDEIQALRQDIAELKSLVHQQAITLDTLSGQQKSLNVPPPAPTVVDRLRSNS